VCTVMAVFMVTGLSLGSPKEEQIYHWLNCFPSFVKRFLSRIHLLLSVLVFFCVCLTVCVCVCLLPSRLSYIQSYTSVYFISPSFSRSGYNGQL